MTPMGKGGFANSIRWSFRSRQYRFSDYHNLFASRLVDNNSVDIVTVSLRSLQPVPVCLQWLRYGRKQSYWGKHRQGRRWWLCREYGDSACKSVDESARTSARFLLPSLSLHKSDYR